MMKRIGCAFLVAVVGLVAIPQDAFAQARDIDFDWIATMLDKLLASYCPGITIKLRGTDNDGNGIWDEDTLAQLATVLRGGTRVGTNIISAANVTQIQADFATNRNLVYNDLMIYGETTVAFIITRAARNYVLNSYGSDKLCEMLKAELGPVGGDLTAGLLLDYMAGLCTVGETVDGNTFTAVNNYISQLIDGLCAGMGNQDLAGVTNMWALLRAEKTARSLWLTTANYTATRWGSGGSRTNLFGKNGIFNASGTPAGTRSNILRYGDVGGGGSTTNTWRENFLSAFGMTQIPLRISTPPHGTPNTNYCNQNDMTNGAGAAPTQWTVGANWASNPQDDVAGVGAPQGQFLVYKHTSGNTAELSQTQAQQPAAAKITAGVTYRVNFMYKTLGTALLTEGVSIGLGTSVSGLYSTDNNDWHTETLYLTAAGANPSIRVIPTNGWTGYVDNFFIFVAALAGDPLDMGTVVTAGGTGAVSNIWEEAQDFPPSNSYNILNNNSFKGNTNNWDIGTWTYLDTTGTFNIYPAQRVEKSTSDTTALTQTVANMKSDKPLRASEWYTVSYFMYQTAGSITPYLSGTALTTRSFVNSGEIGQIVTQTVQNGPAGNPQQITFVPTTTFRGRIYWVYVAAYANDQLDPYWVGDPPGSHRQDFVADGVTGDPNDNGYRGVVPATWNAQYTYLLPWHDGMSPWTRVSDTTNPPTYTSALIYNPPDFAATVPTGSVGEEALGGRTSPLIYVYVGSRAFAISPQPATPLFAYTGQPFSMSSGAVGGDSVPVYQWYKGSPGDTSNPVGAAYSKTYSVASAAPANAGTYFMRATNLLGSLDSNAVVVSVVDPVSITGQPSGGNKAVGGSHTFAATATGGAGALTYALYKVGNGTPIATNGTGSFTLSPLVSGDQGSYYITATDAPAGSSTATSNTVALTVLASTNPSPQTVTSGADNVTFSVTASGGTGGFTYQWYLDGVAVSNAAGHISGATAATLIIDNVQVADGTYTGHPGVYTCVVKDSALAQLTTGGAALTVNAAGISLTGPSNQSVYYTQNATFTVSPSGGSGSGFSYTYTWYQQGNPTPLANGAKYSGVSTATLTVLNCDASDNGTVYYCTVGETPGVRPPANLVTSGNATLSTSLAAINVNLTGATQLYVGDTETLTCTATGGVGTLTYHWQKNISGTWTNVGPATSVYTITPVALGDAGDYRCQVGDDARPPAAYQDSNVLTLQVANRISLSSLATPINRKTADAYTFSVTPSGGFGTLTYQWKRGVTNVGTNSSSLVLSSLTFADQGSYTCAVTDSFTDSKTTNAATLTVLEIQTQPSGANLIPGNAFNTTVTVTPTSGVPGYTYQWQWWNGSGWDNVGTNSATFSIGSVAPADAGRYRCQITDTAAVTLTSGEAVLVVSSNPIVIDTQPQTATKYAMQSQTFTIAAHGGDGTLTYQWQKKNGASWDDVGTGLTSYTINPLALSDAGTYRCLVTDDFSQTATSDEADLTVTVANILVSAPSGANLVVNGSHTFSVTASGGVGTLTYQWQKDGMDVGDAAGHIAGATTDTLDLTNAVLGDAGTYVCLVGDDAHPSIDPLVASVGAVLDVRNPISFSVNPVGANKKEGDNHTFTVTATDGYTPYSYQWYRGLTPVGGNSDTLTLNNLAASDQGSYTCQVMGASGSQATSLAAVLTVLAIQTQPVGQSTSARGSATFTVSMVLSSGVPGYTYQWKYKGADIAGATNASLTLNNCQGGSPDGNPLPVNPAGNEGNYSCVITDSASVALESSAAPLTVNSSALDITGPVSGRAHVGEPFSFSVAVTGGYGPAYTYQWQKEGLDLPTQTTATLSFGSVVSALAGSYVCQIGEVGVRPPLALTPSASATLEVADPVSITGDPSGADLYVGDTFMATVSATGGFSPYTYQWYKGASPLAGKTDATLTLNGVAVGDAGSYTVTVTDDEASSATSGAAVLTVVPHVSITTQPVAGEMQLGVPYSLSVAGTGGMGALHYTWYKAGVQVGVDSPTYDIASPSIYDVGTYWCVVTDSAEPADSAESDHVALTINVVFGFASEPQSTRVYAGDSYVLLGEATFATGNLTYTWYDPQGNVLEPAPGDLEYFRTLQGLTTAMAGEYYVTVVDDMGTPDPADDKTITSEPALVEVHEHLAIATQPYGGSATENGGFDFSVATTGGYGPLTYAWYKEGSATVLSAGATLNLGPLTMADSGTYYVVISDQVSDSLESVHAHLEVNASALPVAGLAGLGALAAAMALAAARSIRKRR